MAITKPQKAPLLLVDAHVHIYDCFDVAELLDAAYKNFSIEARRHRTDKDFQGILLLTETSNDHWYHYVIDNKKGRRFGAWDVNLVESDKISLRAYREPGESLLIIPGRQIITSEGLEVLALLTDQLFEDEDPVADVLDLVRESGGLPVLPWGAGKWFGTRGAIVKRIALKHSMHPIFLGDNGGRPSGLPEPIQFKKAAELGMRVLPGSDPLPLSREVSRVGTFGFGIHAALTTEPIVSLKDHLKNRDIELFPYGRLENPMRFLRNQLSIRMARKNTKI